MDINNLVNLLLVCHVSLWKTMYYTFLLSKMLTQLYKKGKSVTLLENEGIHQQARNWGCSKSCDMVKGNTILFFFHRWIKPQLRRNAEQQFVNPHVQCWHANKLLELWGGVGAWTVQPSENDSTPQTARQQVRELMCLLSAQYGWREKKWLQQAQKGQSRPFGKEKVL